MDGSILKAKRDEDKLFSQENIIAAVCLFIGIVTMVIRAKKGFGSYPDETFFLTIPYRVLHGDSLITDEWHVSQLSSLLQIIPLKLLLFLNGGTDGIVLIWRYYCILWKSVIALIVFHLLRRKCGVWTIPAIAPYFLSIHSGMLSFYYNEIGFSFTLLAGLILTTAQRSKHRRRTFFAAGFVYALSVLGNPFCSVIFFLYTLTVLCVNLIRKAAKRKTPVYEWADPGIWKLIFLGVITAAIPCIIFILSKLNFSTFAADFKMLFRDSEYTFSFVSPGSANILRQYRTEKY